MSRSQEGVCGQPCRAPGAGLAVPPQLLFHPTGNEEAAELCNTAGESLAPACWECRGESPGSGVVGMGFPIVLWDRGRGREASPWWEEWGNWVRASLPSGTA